MSACCAWAVPTTEHKASGTIHVKEREVVMASSLFDTRSATSLQPRPPSSVGQGRRKATLGQRDRLALKSLVCAWLWQGEKITSDNDAAGRQLRQTTQILGAGARSRCRNEPRHFLRRDRGDRAPRSACAGQDSPDRAAAGRKRTPGPVRLPDRDLQYAARRPAQQHHGLGRGRLGRDRRQEGRHLSDCPWHAEPRRGTFR